MRDHKKSSQRAYNAKANKYDKTFDGKCTASFKKLLIEEMEIKKNDKVLDVSCGTGILLNQLSQLHDIKAYGIDISENMIKVAKSMYPNIEFKVSDSESMQFPNDFFNIITVCASFHHYPNPQKFINEVVRLLSKGGCFYIAEVYLPPLIRQGFNVFLPLSNSGDVKVYSPNEILRMLQNAKLKDFKVNRRGLFQIISAKK